MQTLFSWLSSFLTVAALAGFVSLLGQHLCGGNQKKLRYLCALAAAASLAAPLPGFAGRIKSAASEGAWADRISQAAGGDASGKQNLCSRLFSSAAKEALEKNAGDELREKLSLEKEDLALFFTVEPAEAEGEEGKEDSESGDLLFSLQSVRAELYTLRAAAKTAEIKYYLSSFACPVEVQECLLQDG